MTVMIPHVPRPGSTASEKQFFASLRDAPGSEQYVCLHSVGLARHRRKAYGEADFIVLGPEGVFCLELKGGEVHRKAGVWTIGWPGSEYKTTEGPFRQSQSTVYPLIEEIEKRASPDLKRQAMVGWGVVFPDIQFEEADPEWDLRVVCGRRNKHDPIGYLRRLAEYTRERELIAGRAYPSRLGPGQVQRLVDCFRRDFDLVPLLKDLVAESTTELAELGDDQYSILRFALDDRNPRVICEGSAGTGKTLIALEAARRLGRRGLSVLLLCFNRNLARHINKQIEPSDGRIEVRNLHRLMYEAIGNAGMKAELEQARNTTEDGQEFYAAQMPRLFEAALLELASEGQQVAYDVLVIDEAQDILFSPTIDCLDLLLTDGFASGNWLVFLDPDLQSELYGRLDKRVMETLARSHPTWFHLEENFRNPEPIINEVCALTGATKPRCRRRLKSVVEYRTYANDEDQGRKLRAVLVELLRQGIEAEQVTVLSPRRRSEACVMRYPPDVGKPIVYLDGNHDDTSLRGAFTACSVSSFKGMENDVIVLTDVPLPATYGDWEKSAMYVAMTRARASVYALVSKEFIEQR